MEKVKEPIKIWAKPLRNGNKALYLRRYIAGSHSKGYVYEKLDGLIRCSAEQLKELNPQAVIGKRESPYGVEAVVRRAELPSGWEVSPIDIEELFVMMVRGRA